MDLDNQVIYLLIEFIELFLFNKTLLVRLEKLGPIQELSSCRPTKVQVHLCLHEPGEKRRMPGLRVRLLPSLSLSIPCSRCSDLSHAGSTIVTKDTAHRVGPVYVSFEQLDISAHVRDLSE